MKSSNIGGQAVMEGIMMRHKDKYSIAVRRPDNEIELKVEDYKCVFGNAKFLKYPLIRGVVSFVDSLVVGTKCLMYSAEIAGDEEDEEDKQKNAALSEEELAAKKAKEDKQFKWLLYVTVAVSIVVSVAAFMLLPYALASLCRRVGASEFAVTIVEAFVKLALFMGYMDCRLRWIMFLQAPDCIRDVEPVFCFWLCWSAFFCILFLYWFRFTG